MDKIERLKNLIEKGNGVLHSHKPNSPGVIGFPTLDHGMFTSWKSQVLNFLKDFIGNEHEYYKAFSESVDRGYQSSAKAGIEILKNIKEDYNNGYIILINKKI